MPRVEPHDLPIGASAALDLVEQCREAPIALFEAPAGVLGVRRRWRRRQSARMVAVGDFDTLHRTFLGWRIDRLSKPDAEPYSPIAQPSWRTCGVIRNVERTGNSEAQGDTKSEESRGADREDRGGAGARVQGRVEIDLNLGREPQALEEDVIVIELRSPLRVPRRLGHCLQVGLVPKDADPYLVKVVAAERIVVDPTPCDRGLDRGRGSARTVGTQKETPFRIEILHRVERHSRTVARLLRHRRLAVPEKAVGSPAKKIRRPLSSHEISIF